MSDTENRTWKVKDAKNQLSKVMKLAETEGPQLICKRGFNEAVILSMDEYTKLLAAAENVKNTSARKEVVWSPF